MFMERNPLHFLGVVVDRRGNEEAVYQFLQALQREKHIFYIIAPGVNKKPQTDCFLFLCVHNTLTLYMYS